MKTQRSKQYRTDSVSMSKRGPGGIALIVLGVLLTGALTACGQSDEEPDQTQENQTLDSSNSSEPQSEGQETYSVDEASDSEMQSSQQGSGNSDQGNGSNGKERVDPEQSDGEKNRVAPQESSNQDMQSSGSSQ